MPTKYTDRLKIPLEGVPGIRFTTNNGLAVATGYERVVFTNKGPLVEFQEDHLVKENIVIPEALVWRTKHPAAKYIEYRSRDYCSVRISLQRVDEEGLLAGRYYASPFDLRSDKYPVLIAPLRRRRIA